MDQGFSFYEAYSQIPILEFEGEEFSVFKDYDSLVPTKELIGEVEQLENQVNQRPLKDFAEEQELKVATLRKIIYLLEEQGIDFDRSDSAILVTPLQEELLLETLLCFEEGGRRSYAKAVQMVLSHQELGQGQGQA